MTTAQTETIKAGVADLDLDTAAQAYWKYGIGVALVVVGGWLAKLLLTKAAEKLTGTAAESIIALLAAKNAVHRYRRAVHVNYSQSKLGFVETETFDLRKIYIPLEVEEQGRRRDIRGAIKARRVVILGPPGAGKTLLLKKELADWAESHNGLATKIPVLIDLHRCNESSKDLHDLLLEVLASNQVRGVQRFADSTLSGGKLRILFDGFDEVRKDDRPRVTGMISDLARRYPDCELVVTCRDASYQGQLSPEFTNVVKIADFDDASIIRFLRLWPDMPPGEADNLYRDLQQRPHLMRLAASPLLLTIIAYLYAGTLVKVGRSLPTSRSAFYQVAVDHLLRRDHDLVRYKVSVYDGHDKKTTLQRVALVMQQANRADRADRLSIERADIVAVARGLMPDLGLAVEHAPTIIDEIVERSQLLVRLDRRASTYSFRHLTLQEYLVAVELAADPRTLISNYHSDPDGWRETVKLWCGVSTRECTDVVMALASSLDDRDQILALECLVEARRIDDIYARSLITEAAGWLDRHDGTDELVEVLASIASDGRDRGVHALAALTALARSSRPGRDHALMAIASSRKPIAPDLLARFDVKDMAAALRKMGDRSIPLLRRKAEAGDGAAVDILASIRTPEAAKALVALIWCDGPVATRAAWHLAFLVGYVDIESALRREDNVLPVERPPSIEWVWSPFRRDGMTEVLEAIMGRVARLMMSSDTSAIPADVRQVDPRIGIPLAVVRHSERVRIVGPPSRELTDKALELFGRRVKKWADIGAALSNGARGRLGDTVEFCADVLRARAISPIRIQILRLLGPDVMVMAVHSIFCTEIPRSIREEDWTAVNHVPARPIIAGPALWVSGGLVAVALVLVPILRGIGTVTGFWPFQPRWILAACAGYIGLTAVAFSLLSKTSGKRELVYVIVSVLSLLGLTWGLLSISWYTASEYVGPLWASLLLAGLIGTVLSLGKVVYARKRALANPLRLLLDMSRRRPNAPMRRVPVPRLPGASERVSRGSSRLWRG